MSGDRDELTPEQQKRLDERLEMWRNRRGLTIARAVNETVRVLREMPPDPPREEEPSDLREQVAATLYDNTGGLISSFQKADRVIQMVRAADRAIVEERLRQIERDRREPDKVLCGTASLRSDLSRLGGDREEGAA